MTLHEYYRYHVDYEWRDRAFLSTYISLFPRVYSNEYKRYLDFKLKRVLSTPTDFGALYTFYCKEMDTYLSIRLDPLSTSLKAVREFKQQMVHNLLSTKY